MCSITFMAPKEFGLPVLILFILPQIAEYDHGINYHSNDSGMGTINTKTCQKAIPCILIPEWFPKNAPLMFGCEGTIRKKCSKIIFPIQCSHFRISITLQDLRFLSSS